MGHCVIGRADGFSILVSFFSITEATYRIDVVVVIFRALQWFVSPHIGSLSDKYGRKRILLLTMIGNVLSALV